jgi:anti-sigma regulatory factor (Ser/Thr protein kinase)
MVSAITEQARKLRLKAILENIPRAIDCVAKSARAAGFDEQAQHQIQLAVDEACANVVLHAYKGMEPGDMEISCHLDGQGLVIEVRDWGRSFDPAAVPEPDVSAPLEERTLGGLGLFLIKRSMDNVQFTFDPEHGNELRMEKRFQIER